MSGITEIRSYFRSNMIALNYREHKDAFNFENIPSTLLNNSFHIENPSGGRRGEYLNEGQELEIDCVLRVFFKGYRSPADAVDNALTALDTILTRVLNSERRIGSNLKNIYFNDYRLEPLNQTNDNAAILQITLKCLVYICT